MQSLLCKGNALRNVLNNWWWQNYPQQVLLHLTENVSSCFLVAVSAAMQEAVLYHCLQEASENFSGFFWLPLVSIRFLWITDRTPPPIYQVPTTAYMGTSTVHTRWAGIHPHTVPHATSCSSIFTAVSCLHFRTHSSACRLDASQDQTTVPLASSTEFQAKFHLPVQRWCDSLQTDMPNNGAICVLVH